MTNKEIKKPDLDVRPPIFPRPMQMLPYMEDMIVLRVYIDIAPGKFLESGIAGAVMNSIEFAIKHPTEEG